MRGKRILITGAAGSIGSELVRQLACENQIYGLDINESGLFDVYEEQKLSGCKIKTRVGDIRNLHTVDLVMSDFKPEVIFHCAAYKHVTPMEHTPREAVETNVLGTINLVEAAKRYAIKQFVFISSDKAVNASSVMGVSKRMGELVVKNAGYVSVRFGNVLGSRGSLIPIWQRQADFEGPITVTDSQMERFFMTISDAVNLVIEAAQIGKPGEIVILDMGKRINILELAKKVIEESGRDIPIKQIGVRPGETIKEKLMYEDEESAAVKKGRFYIIPNA